ncbi:hypothetical protein PTKIN_Ptkin02bG0174900 [Pterospermum kingtungense]
MAQSLFFFSLLILSLAAMQRTHAVDYAVTDNTGNTSSGVRFRNEIGIDYSLQTMGSATDFIWRTFQQNTPADRKDVPKVTLFIENGEGNALAYAVNNEIHVRANKLGTSGDAKWGFAGVIYHEMAHIWQWNGNGQAPGELIDGIADFVRLKANYIPSHWVQPGQGVKWDQGYDVTARFLDYCNSLRNGFVAELNKKMRTGYNDSYFVDILGKTVEQLWSDYKAKYGN